MFFKVHYAIAVGSSTIKLILVHAHYLIKRVSIIVYFQNLLTVFELEYPMWYIMVCKMLIPLCHMFQRIFPSPMLGYRCVQCNLHQC